MPESQLQWHSNNACPGKVKKRPTQEFSLLHDLRSALIANYMARGVYFQVDEIS